MSCNLLLVNNIKKLCFKFSHLESRKSKVECKLSFHRVLILVSLQATLAPSIPPTSRSQLLLLNLTNSPSSPPIPSPFR